MPLGVAVLGSTGSIGRSALAVLARHPEQFRVVALAAHRNETALCGQVAQLRPDLAVLVEENGAPDGSAGIRRGEEALLEAARHPAADIVINAVVGAAGLQATLAALSAGKRLALANKESLVAGGALVLETLRTGGGQLVPIDSEHSAILQCLQAGSGRFLRRLILTASGGPFRDFAGPALAGVTPEQALRHPTWDMGAKITIDSATLANKALEVIEGHFLFDIGYEAIDVVVHPQSIVHSMVELIDGSVLAQLGFPNMELPILYALTYPDRLLDTGVRTFDPVAAAALTFQAVDAERFPAFQLGLDAGRAGGTATAVYNAANEVAVARFLRHEIAFTAIPRVIETVLAAHELESADTLEKVLHADRWARDTAARTAATPPGH